MREKSAFCTHDRAEMALCGSCFDVRCNKNYYSSIQQYFGGSMLGTILGAGKTVENITHWIYSLAEK